MKNKNKPILTDAPDYLNTDVQEDPKLKRINSTKNCYQLTKFKFPNPRIDKFTKFDKINKLEKEKAQLIKSLEILKDGAVSAIIEKEQIIEKFKKSFLEENYDDQNNRMQELQKLLSYIKDLEEERDQLNLELQRQRSNFCLEIQDKQKYLKQAIQQVNYLHNQIEKFQNHENALLQKISDIEHTNQNLSVMLSNSEASLTAYRKDSQIDTAQSFSANNQQEKQNSKKQQAEGKKITFQIDDIILKSEFQKMIQAKKNELNVQHQLEIKDLTSFYENRIDSLKRIFANQSIDRYYQKEDLPQFKNPQKMPIANIPQQYSTNQSTDSKITRRQYERILKTNFSLNSLQSGFSLNAMESIDEREEIEQKYGILRRDLMQQSVSVSRISNEESFQLQKIEEVKQSEGSKSFDNSRTLSSLNKKLFKNNNKEIENNYLDKVGWFTLGTVTGCAIISLCKKFLTK